MNNVFLKKVKNSLLCLAIGDALGVPVEFKSRQYLSSHPVTKMTFGGIHEQPAGTWSDDTSITLCMIDAISTSSDENIICKNFAQNLIDWYYKGKFAINKKVFDCGGTVSGAVVKIATGTNFIHSGGTDKNDNGNGALMRILPLAFYFKEKNVNANRRKAIVHKVSGITHNHIISKIACHIYVEYAMQLLEDVDKISALKSAAKIIKSQYQEDELFDFNMVLSGKIADIEDSATIKSSGYVIDTLHASIWSVLKNNTLKDTILSAVNLGNDSDTIGAVTGGLAGLIYEKKDVPFVWLIKLRGKSIIRHYFKKYCKSIMNRQQKSRT